MRVITEAIVIGLRKRTDKMSLLQVYTKRDGMLCMQVYGAMGSKKVRAAYQPLSVVELSYEQNPVRTMPIASTVEPVFLPERVYADVRRQSIAIFVTEILMLTLTHPLQDEQLYTFLREYINELNNSAMPENAHLSFLFHLAGHLGIGTPDLKISGPIASATLNRHGRQAILRTMCDYYAEHLDGFRSPKSLDILIEIFD